MYLFIDTETTGLYTSDKVVEIAAILCDERGNEWGSINFLINNDCDIPPEASNIHGITRENCEDYGVPRETFVQLFIQMVDKCDFIIAHNLSYDLRMLQQYFVPFESSIIQSKKQFCTMLKSTNICQCVNKNGGKKFPKLSEAYKIICGEDLQGAHRALADAKACREIFFKLKEMGCL